MAVTYGVTYVSSPNPSQLLLAISLLKFYLFLVLAALGLHCCVNFRCREEGLLSSCGQGLLIAVGSLVGRARAQWL